MTPEPLKVYLDSYGCQMNLYDGEIVSSLLQADGFVITSRAAEAQVILINTCGVRDHAEQRVLGRLRTLAALKRRHSRLIIGVLGCMAERLRESLQDQIPEVDLVLGPDAYRQLPHLLKGLISGDEGIRGYSTGALRETYGDVQPSRREGINAFVAIMRGCDNFCSYCIVPYVRGRERSRPPEEIYREINEAVAAGFPEVMLLGQNVNSYRHEEVGFPELLDGVAQITGLKRLRFLTSHPKDLSDALIERMAQGGVICPSLHLPAQSGSDRILTAMKRGYTSEKYLTKVEQLRSAVPDLALTTDLLCGFPAETEEDFRQTLELIEAAQFDDAFTFKYSVRPGTEAAKLPDDVPEAVKVERMERMIASCRQQANASRKRMIGQQAEVLLEKVSPKNSSEWSGRTACGRMALVPGEFNRGDFVRIRVKQVKGFSMWGRKVNYE
ncbi:MAG: tRNA (N6-isopentenyl adenosine(37)-C2)-methylthiotransferase MiaB [bacterium]|nr:tRNA (N6-isopentenyl adenosine(37)-C2)-methylthiotransferase MiaB [bacterium]